MQPIDKNIWTQDKSGKFRQLHAKHDISLDFETNSIRFRIKADNFSHGYVLGKFNNWERHDDLKMTWTADTDDGNLWLSKNVLGIPNLINGTNQYTFILVDLDGNEQKVSMCDNSFVPLTFNWQTNSDRLYIKSSEDFIIPGYKLDLVAITESLTKRREIVDVEWSVEPATDKITITNNKLIADADIDGINEVTISCFNKNNPEIKAQRFFRITKEQRQGKLVHFIKKDEKYRGENFSWDLWTFGADNQTRPKSLSKRSDFGLYAECNKENIIARKRMWSMYWQNDWAEQTNTFQIFNDHDNYYIVYEDPTIYTSLIDVINRTNARITYAVLNDPNKVVAYLSDQPLIGTVFELWINSQKIKNVETIVKYKSKKVIFTNLPSNIHPSDLIEIRANNTFMPTKVKLGNFLDNFYYPKDDMGVHFSSSNISLRIWAPTAKKVELLTYNEDVINNNENPDGVYALDPEMEYGTHHINLPKYEGNNKYYLYRLYFDDLDPRGRQYTKVTYAVDPYACGIGLNGEKGFLVDLNSPEVTPENCENNSHPQLSNEEDAILYELHLRDFTINIDSGIPEEIRGKFLGAVYEGAKYIDEDTGTQVSTGIDSICDLGVTHVHLLPIFDFSSVDESKPGSHDNRNWGYDPKNYNAPDGTYSINPFDPHQRIKGVREMVAGFNKRGVGVIMDMVYNHMTDTSNLDKIVPNYYFRTDELGHFTNGSGCGNEMDTEKPMVSKFIQDSVLHWVKNYSIDGVRFDLMELIDLQTIKNIVKKVKDIDPNIIVYGEPWKAGDSPLTNGTYRGTQRNQDFSVFNDLFRDAIRGNNSPGNGFANGDPHNPSNIGKVMEGLRGSIHDLSFNPKETINYVDAHDNYTLWDQIEKSQQRNIMPGDYRRNLPENIFDSRRVRQNALSLGIILTSQGIPFLHGGCEFLRTKQGDHNSYKSNDDINAFYWKDKLTFLPFFNYIKGLIKLRKEHPAFRMTTSADISRHLNVTSAHHDNHSGVIVSHFKDNANGDSWKDIVIVYNAAAIDNYEVNDILPIPESGKWHIVANHQTAGTDTILECSVGRLPPLRSYSMLIIHS